MTVGWPEVVAAEADVGAAVGSVVVAAGAAVVAAVVAAGVAVVAAVVAVGAALPVDDVVEQPVKARLRMNVRARNRVITFVFLDRIALTVFKMISLYIFVE